MTDDRKPWQRRPGCTGCTGCFSGCGTFIFVFLVGGLLSLFGIIFGLGLSVGVPGMQSNITAAGAIGTKSSIVEGLPTYARERLAGNGNFINQSGTLTIGPAEGAFVFIVGSQPGAPAVDLFIVVR